MPLLNCRKRRNAANNASAVSQSDKGKRRRQCKQHEPGEPIQNGVDSRKSAPHDKAGNDGRQLYQADNCKHKICRSIQLCVRLHRPAYRSSPQPHTKKRRGQNGPADRANTMRLRVRMFAIAGFCACRRIPASGVATEKYCRSPACFQRRKIIFRGGCGIHPS